MSGLITSQPSSPGLRLDYYQAGWKTGASGQAYSASRQHIADYMTGYREGQGALRAAMAHRRWRGEPVPGHVAGRGRRSSPAVRRHRREGGGPALHVRCVRRGAAGESSKGRVSDEALDVAA